MTTIVATCLFFRVLSRFVFLVGNSLIFTGSFDTLSQDDYLSFLLLFFFLLNSFK